MISSEKRERGHAATLMRFILRLTCFAGMLHFLDRGRLALARDPDALQHGLRAGNDSGDREIASSDLNELLPDTALALPECGLDSCARLPSEAVKSERGFLSCRHTSSGSFNPHGVMVPP